MIRIAIINREKHALIDAIPRLIARLPPTHPKIKLLEDELYRREAGYSGETNVDAFIKRTNFSKQPKVFTNVHLKVSPTFSFEIDTLIITNHYVLIIEVKNLKGVVQFVENPPHLRRTLDTGEVTIMDCPICQIEMNKVNLDKWFRKHGIQVDLMGLFVLANQNTIVEDVPEDFQVVYRRQLPHFLSNLKPSEMILSDNQLKDITWNINNDQQNFNPFPLCSYYKIDPLHLKRGLLCRNCHSALFRNTRETWHCINCKKDAEDPYNDAISDWLLLVKNSITNRECRYFLNLKNKRVSNYYLRQSHLTKSGSSVATFYIQKKIKH